MNKYFNADSVIDEIGNFEFGQVVFSANKVRIFGRANVIDNKVSYFVEVMYDDSMNETFSTLKEAMAYAEDKQRVR